MATHYDMDCNSYIDCFVRARRSAATCGFFRIMAYFVAIARALPHVGRTGKIRYLLALSFMNFDTAGQLMTTDAGKAAHDQVLQRLNRGIRSFFYAFGAAIVAIAISFGLELAGILPVA